MRIFIGFMALLASVSVSAQIYTQPKVYRYECLVTSAGKTENHAVFLKCWGQFEPHTNNQEYKISWMVDKYSGGFAGNETGAAEKQGRVYLHPPRIDVFKILEYSPFPQYLYQDNWEWSLQPGSNWINESLGITTNTVIKYKYSIQKLSYRPSFVYANLDCIEVSAGSQNLPSQTKFIGIFSPQYGFVTMHFENLDGSRMDFKMNGVFSEEELLKQDRGGW